MDTLLQVERHALILATITQTLNYGKNLMRKEYTQMNITGLLTFLFPSQKEKQQCQIHKLMITKKMIVI